MQELTTRASTPGYSFGSHHPNSDCENQVKSHLAWIYAHARTRVKYKVVPKGNPHMLVKVRNTGKHARNTFWGERFISGEQRSGFLWPVLTLSNSNWFVCSLLQQLSPSGKGIIGKTVTVNPVCKQVKITKKKSKKCKKKKCSKRKKCSRKKKCVKKSKSKRKKKKKGRGRYRSWEAPF